MRDINNILELFSNKYNMDFCRHFERIKSTLEFCNGHVKKLDKIHFRGGNESEMNEIISKLEDIFEGLNPVDNEQDFRKITFFLILNTDATFPYDLKSDQQIYHVLDITPKIPKCLQLAIIWELKLDKFFYECLIYTPCWFSLQFIEATVTSLKYLEPYDMLEKVESLVTAIFANICRSDFRQIDAVTKKIILNKLHDHSMELLRQFYTPDIENFSDWSKDEFYKYSGFGIRHILKMVLFCFDNLECRVRRKVEDKYSIYEICKDISLKSETLEVGYSEEVEEILKKILVALLNTLQYNVMLVTIDVFMYWVEVDINSELTLQADIGDYAYRTLERMSTNNRFRHDVETHLKFIAIKRKSLKEIIKGANIGDIIRKLESVELPRYEKHLWLSEFLTRPIIYGNDECLETIVSNAALLTYDDCIQIIESVKTIQDDASEDNCTENIDETVPLILTKALDNLKVDQLVELLLYEIKLFGNDVTLFESDEFEQKCISFLNKSTENMDLKLFLQLCFENPMYTWKKVFYSACTSQQQAKSFCVLAKSIIKVSKLYLQDLLDLTFTAYCEEKFYPVVLFELHESGAIDKDAFFKSFIYKKVNATIETSEIALLLPLLKALNTIAHKTKTVPTFGAVTAPVLIMIAEILDRCRWDLVTYSDLNDEIVRLSIDCIQTTSKTFLPVVTEKVRVWITTKVKSLKPLTRYYFQKYSLTASEQPKTFDEFLRDEPVTDQESIEKFLIKNYVRCTMKETEWLAKSTLLRPHISNIILLLESLATDIGDSAMPNLRNSIMNYANLIKKIILPDNENANEKSIELGFTILKIIRNSPDILYDDVFMNFHAILIEVFGNSRPLNDDRIKEIKEFVFTMKNCKGKEIFEQKFEECFIRCSL